MEILKNLKDTTEWLLNPSILYLCSKFGALGVDLIPTCINSYFRHFIDG